MSLSCESVRDRLASADDAAEVQTHVAGCAACAAFASALSSVDEDLEHLPRLDAPEALVAATLARVLESESPSEAPAVEVGSRSILVLAFATLTAALGALIVAPLTFVRWLSHAGRALRASTDRAVSSSPEPREAPQRSWVFRQGPSLAALSSLAALVLFMTFQRVGSTVKTKTRGAEAVVNGLPTSSEEEANSDSWWVGNARSAPSAAASVAPALAATPTSRFGIEGPDDSREQALFPDESAQIDQQRVPRAQAVFAPTLDDGLGALEGEPPLVLRGEDTDGESVDGLVLARPPTDVSGLAGRQGGDALDLPADGRFATQLSARDAATESALWLAAQRTTGLRLAARDGWWENTYVPGDASIRMLHARLATATDRSLAGLDLSPLGLASSAAPTVPAVAAPTDRAVGLGVHADVAAIDGPTRVRVEVAVRGITQPAGRRGALRIALVVDARDTLDAGAQGRIRALALALSRSMSSRDRVMLVAAGSHGGTLVELSAMRAGQVEVALRHLFAGDGETSPASLQQAVETALAGVASDDGAGLVLVATPDGEHDAGVDQALHVGALAGVVTSAIGLSSAVALSDIDAIALAGQGRRRLVLDEADAIDAVRSELTATARLVARALRIRVRLAPGVELVDVLGSRPLDADESRRTRETEQAIDRQLAQRLGIASDRDADDDGIRILLPSFYAGDSHTVVLDLLVSRAGPVADVDLEFKDLVRLGNGTVSASLTLASGRAPRGPHEQRVVASFLAQEVAGALGRAGDQVALSDWASARATLLAARELIAAARADVPALVSSPSVQADDVLLGRYLTALGQVGDASLVADSLHFAAHRRLVLPQLASARP